MSCDPESLPGTGSAVAALTVAVFVYVPAGAARFAVTDTVMTHEAAAASVGRVHVTALPTWPQAPDGEVTFVTVNCAGTVSETCTVEASDGPLFVTVSVYVNACPGTTGSAESIFTIARSADRVTLSVSVAALFAPFGSAAGVDVMDAVLDRFAGAKLAATASVS